MYILLSSNAKQNRTFSEGNAFFLIPLGISRGEQKTSVN